MTIYEAADQAGIQTRSRMTYAVRPRQGQQRSTRLTFEELTSLAGVLEATEPERYQLIVLALKEELSPMMRRYLERFEADSADLRDRLGLPALRPRLEMPSTAADADAQQRPRRRTPRTR